MSSVKTRREQHTSEGPGSSVTKTTAYSSSSDGGSSYRPISMAKGRSSYGRSSYGGGMKGGIGGSMITRSYTSNVSSGYSGANPGAYKAVSEAGVNQLVNSRTHEKKDMQDLNERFAGYIEKVRFLEAQNKKLSNELKELRDKWGKPTAEIKAMYETELKQQRELYDEAETEKNKLQLQVDRLKDLLEESQKKNDDLTRYLEAERERVKQQDQQISDYTAELELLRRRIEGLERERAQDKNEIQRLVDELFKTRCDLDNETLARIDAENRLQTLIEEIEFLKGVHEQELKDLAALAYRDTTEENRAYWKTELAQAMREIQEEYDRKVDVMKSQTDTFYNLKLQEFKTGNIRTANDLEHCKEEIKRLRAGQGDLNAKIGMLEAENAALRQQHADLLREYEEHMRECDLERNNLRQECGQLQAELEKCVHELQELLDAKLSLELEIAAYRKLLEGEETRFQPRNLESWITQTSGGGGLQQSSRSSRSTYQSSTTGTSATIGLGGGGSGGSGGSGGGSEQSFAQASMTIGQFPDDDVSQVLKGEMSARTTYQRSAKGPVSISEVCPNGTYITLENTGRKDEKLDGWCILRKIDGKQEISYNFDEYTLGFKSHEKKITVWSKGRRPSGSSDLEGNHQTWGTGANVTTILYNSNKEERAQHIQKTVYTS